MMTYRKTATGWGRIDINDDKAMEKLPELFIAIGFTPIPKKEALPHHKPLPKGLQDDIVLNPDEPAKIGIVGTKEEVENFENDAFFVLNVTACGQDIAKDLSSSKDGETFQALWTRLNKAGAKTINFNIDTELARELKEGKAAVINEPDPRDERPMNTPTITNEDLIAQHHREITLLLNELPKAPHPDEMRQGVVLENNGIRIVENLDPVASDEIASDVLQTLALERKIGEGWETVGRFGPGQLRMLCVHEAEQERIRAGQEPEDGEISVAALPWATPAKLNELEEEIRNAPASAFKKIATASLTTLGPDGKLIILTLGRAIAIVDQLKEGKVAGVPVKNWPPVIPETVQNPDHPLHRRAILVVETMLENPSIAYETSEHNGMEYAEFIRQRTNHKIVDQNISAIPSADLFFLTKQKLADISLNMKKKDPIVEQAVDLKPTEKSKPTPIEHEPQR